MMHILEPCAGEDLHIRDADCLPHLPISQHSQSEPIALFSTSNATRFLRPDGRPQGPRPTETSCRSVQASKS